jgi:translation elongation factor EF-Tu-like GTPase
MRRATDGQNLGMDPDREHDRWTALELERGYIRARLRLLTTEQGGRHTPIRSGYRSHWAFPPDVHQEDHDAPLTLEATKVLAPGEEAMVRLHPLAPDLWPPVAPGLRLSMFEGARLVGQADVVAVVPPVV